MVLYIFLNIFKNINTYRLCFFCQLGGVIKPNDGMCHLNQNGIYTESSYQDYPSISQINMLAKQHSVNIIFAVTESQQTVYQQLTQHIEGSSCAKLSEDSSNVVELVREEYDVSFFCLLQC